MKSFISTQRRGMATLEFVMALPFLLLLMVAITWLGFSVIGQTEVIVEARNKAWQRRFEKTEAKPLMFPTGFGDVKNPEYSQEADYVTEEATKKIDVSPIFSMVPGPKSSHTILANSWDWRAMPLDAPPDWTLIAYAFANAKTGKIQSGLAIVDNLQEILTDAVAKALAEAAAKATSLGGKGGSGSIEDLGSAPDGPPEDAENNAEGPEQQKDKDTQKLREDQTRLKNEIKAVDDELKPLRDYMDKNPPPPPTDLKKVLEYKDKQQQIELLETKKDRLQSDLNDVEFDLSKSG